MKKKLLSRYTKLESAKGILGENPNFWFTKISGQNDIQERNLAENFLKNIQKSIQICIVQVSAGGENIFQGTKYMAQKKHQTEALQMAKI